MGIDNIRQKGFEIEILNQKYNYRLTMLSNEWLAEKYGSSKAAYDKLVECSLALADPEIAKNGVPPETNNVILDFLYAGILNNKYDKKGNVIREVPEPFELKMEMVEADYFPIARVIALGQKEALPEKVEGAEDVENPQK